MDAALEKAQVSQIDDALNTNGNNNDAENDLNKPQRLAGDAPSDLRLDKHWLPLVPQPTKHKDDPLVSLTNKTIIHQEYHDSNIYRTGLQHSSSSSLFKSAG